MVLSDSWWQKTIPTPDTPAASICFEIWGSWIRVNKISIFQANFREISNFSGNFTKNFDFSGQILEQFQFFQAILKNSDFPGKNCSFTATSGQIILFLFKSHHFQTNFQYIIRYRGPNNISRPVHDLPAIPLLPPTTPLPKIWGSRPPTSQN